MHNENEYLEIFYPNVLFVQINSYGHDKGKNYNTRFVKTCVKNTLDNLPRCFRNTWRYFEESSISIIKNSKDLIHDGKNRTYTTGWILRFEHVGEIPKITRDIKELLKSLKFLLDIEKTWLGKEL